MATRWGIVSAGRISQDFTCVLVYQDSKKHQAVAVAARSEESARRFAEHYDIKTAYGSYKELVENPDIDIVYIGSINPQHHRLCVLALKAGKHVLCEKPVTMTLAAAKELFTLAKAKKLFFMEGYWSRFFPVYQHLRKELNSGILGDIKLVTVTFCVNIYNQVERIREKEQGGGALLDIGCYTVMFAEFVFQEKPEKIVVTGQLSDTGVDTGGVITLTYSGGRMANLVYSTLTECDNNAAIIMGSKGCIQVAPNFWEPNVLCTPIGKFEYPFPESNYTAIFNFGEQSQGFQYQQEHVRDCLKQGLLESPIMTHESSLNIMEIIETVLQKLGVTYDFPYTV